MVVGYGYPTWYEVFLSGQEDTKAAMLSSMRGLIALDIDGTLTSGLDGVSTSVLSYLSELSAKGWELAFVTGRSFSWTYPALKELAFPFHIAVQNGALLFELPTLQLVDTRKVDGSYFMEMDKICAAHETDYAIFAWVDGRDVVYYRPDRHREQLRSYLESRAHKLGETWIAVDHYEEVTPTGASSLKVIADAPTAGFVAQKVEEALGLNCPLIHDPYQTAYYVAQVTHPQANKGQAVRALYNRLGGKGPIIAAGDDYNDRPMLELADYTIVMQTAPEELHLLADTIAPPAAEKGVIEGLRKAISTVEN